jgi:hypothetical protein
LFFKKKQQIDAATNLTLKYVERVNNMERYLLSWTQAKKPFGEKQQILAKIDDNPEEQLGSDLPMSANHATIDLPTGSSGYVYINTIGDNGSQAPSASLTFVAENEDTIDAATGLSLAWQEHIA